MSAVTAKPQSAIKTFAIFALVGPFVGAILLFLPIAPNVIRWLSVDSRIFWSGFIEAGLLIYPVGIWPALIAGAAVAWRDRSTGGTSLIFAMLASLIAGIIWVAVYELFLLNELERSLFAEANLLRLIACVAAGMFCWWLSRAGAETAAA